MHHIINYSKKILMINPQLINSHYSVCPVHSRVEELAVSNEFLHIKEVGCIMAPKKITAES